MIRSTAFAITVLLIATTSVSANWLDFSGWDDANIRNGGQLFSDIFGTVDVRVTHAGAVEPSSAIGDRINFSGNSNRQSYAFNFSEPLDLMVEFRTLDPQEQLTVSSINPIQYEHVNGSLPNINGNILRGTAFGISPVGVSTGVCLLYTSPSPRDATLPRMPSSA